MLHHDRVGVKKKKIFWQTYLGILREVQNHLASFEKVGNNTKQTLRLVN